MIGDHDRCRLFFALRLPDAAAEAVDRLRRTERARLRRHGPLAPRHRLHLSLNGLGRYAALPEARVRLACEAVAALRPAAFAISFNRVGGWGRGAGERPVVLWGDDGVIGADLLHETLHEALAAAGVVSGARREFTPHVTLWRDPQPTREVLIEPVTWWVREFHLLAAVRGRARHAVLGRWRLGG